MYSICYSEIVVKEHIPRMNKSARDAVRKAIEKKLTLHPIEFGKPLQYSYRGHRCLCVADYRVIYRVDVPKKSVFIVAIGHRKDIYDE
jgi:mRNA-degrading endonuclease RelE of RelBE toxin-antitoxin system